jgi:REP element-mobilizing transposase RayT
MSKYKYYGIKLLIFHDLFMHNIFYDVCVFYDVWVLRHRSMDTKIHPIFQPIEKRVTWKIKWFRFTSEIKGRPSLQKNIVSSEVLWTIQL